MRLVVFFIEIYLLWLLFLYVGRLWTRGVQNLQRGLVSQNDFMDFVWSSLARVWSFFSLELWLGLILLQHSQRRWSLRESSFALVPGPLAQIPSTIFLLLSSGLLTWLGLLREPALLSEGAQPSPLFFWFADNRMGGFLLCYSLGIFLGLIFRRSFIAALLLPPLFIPGLISSLGAAFLLWGELVGVFFWALVWQKKYALRPALRARFGVLFLSGLFVCLTALGWQNLFESIWGASGGLWTRMSLFASIFVPLFILDHFLSAGVLHFLDQRSSYDEELRFWPHPAFVRSGWIAKWAFESLVPQADRAREEIKASLQRGEGLLPPAIVQRAQVELQHIQALMELSGAESGVVK
ncbi:MAG: hypothetical protein WCH11_02495 [Bdellovibrio sp.]